MPQRPGQQAKTDHAIAHNHHRGEERVARKLACTRTARQHQRHDERHLDDGDREREDQRAVRLAYTVRHDLRVMHGGEHGRDQRRRDDREQQPTERTMPREREDQAGCDGRDERPAKLPHAPRFSTTPESWPARGEARKHTVSPTCSGSMTFPISSSKRLSSPHLAFAAAFISVMMRSVRVEGGCRPTTRTPCSREPLPIALVNAARPALAVAPQMYSNGWVSPAMPMTLTMTPLFFAFMRG